MNERDDYASSPRRVIRNYSRSSSGRVWERRKKNEGSRENVSSSTISLIRSIARSFLDVIAHEDETSWLFFFFVVSSDRYDRLETARTHIVTATLSTTKKFHQKSKKNVRIIKMAMHVRRSAVRAGFDISLYVQLLINAIAWNRLLCNFGTRSTSATLLRTSFRAFVTEKPNKHAKKSGQKKLK